jgi:glycosyltransferase involved in cell wall biosynthesis
MSMKKVATISVVIPAYNEGYDLEPCLEALARQRVKPLEVLVVDNNSTDNTIEIAKKYSFVKVLHEKQQGVVFARDKGFNAARGDIIARIDADTVVPKGWTKQIQTIFKNDAIDAVSGKMYYNVGLAHIVNQIDLYFRRRISRLLGQTNTVFLQGANMAMRKEAWGSCKHAMCREQDMHEDFDLAIHLQEYGNSVVFDERLTATISARRIDSGFVDFINYVRMSPHTYALHELKSRRHMYSAIALVIVCYVPARIVYRGYCPDRQQFMWSRVFMSRATERRTDPTKLYF